MNVRQCPQNRRPIPRAVSFGSHSMVRLKDPACCLQAQLAAELERADGLREDVARLRAQAIATPRTRKVHPLAPDFSVNVCMRCWTIRSIHWISPRWLEME